MARLLLLLGDQLHRDFVFDALNLDSTVGDTILMVESSDFVGRRAYHRKKIALVWSAMRHFAEELRSDGIPVLYVDFADNRRFREAVVTTFRDGHFEQIAFVRPREKSTRRGLLAFLEAEGIPIDEAPDPFWFTAPSGFWDWLESRRSSPKMEEYYRDVRRRTGVLMERDKPVGGMWNYDKENRKPFPKGHKPVPPFSTVPDEITRSVMATVDGIENLYGQLEGFALPACRNDAQKALSYFVSELLPNFGAYEDAMSASDPFGFHSILSPLLNLSILSPKECIDAAVDAFESGNAPLNSVEGFVRQILGWREFVYHMHENFPGDYHATNALEHTRQLPAWFWTGKTQMNCLHHIIDRVLKDGYSHHIERLMVVGNFALLYGTDPHAVNEWFWSLYIDAYEWVVTPNVVGMSQFADGGWIATKPYISSGAYIQRMSDYCKGCRYDPKKSIGQDACPFTTLYWAFLVEHRDQPLSQRMTQNLFGLRGKSEADLEAIVAAKRVLLTMVDDL